MKNVGKLCNSISYAGYALCLCVSMCACVCVLLLLDYFSRHSNIIVMQNLDNQMTANALHTLQEREREREERREQQPKEFLVVA